MAKQPAKPREPRAVTQRKAGILWSWDIRGMSPCDASRTPESAQVTIGERTEAVPACKAVGVVGGRVAAWHC